MEKETSIKTRPTGIPRLSRIPLPATTPSRSLRPSPSRERLQADQGLDVKRLRRPSENVFKKPYLPASASANNLRTPDHHLKTTQRPASCGEATPPNHKFSSELYEANDNILSPSVSRNVSTPSLSDRTVETLARLPPSPSPGKKSNLFLSPNPMRSPSRSSNHGNQYSRPSSRQSTTDLPNGLPSPSRSLRKPRASVQSDTFSSSTTKRSSSMFSNKVSRTPKSGNQEPSSEYFGSLSSDLSQEERSIVGLNTPVPGKSKSMTVRPKKSRPSLHNVFPELSHLEMRASAKDCGESVSSARKPSAALSSNLTSPTSTASKVSSRTSVASDANPPELTPKENDTKKASKSSSALRESIAKAKAARKAAREGSSKSNGIDNSFDDTSAKDPLDQLLDLGASKTVLRNKTVAARKSGHLNICAMGLKEIPHEVLTMYDFDPESNSDWYENVDLVKLLAADNEFDLLPDNAFPDIDIDSMDADEDVQGNQFIGLEHMDLHGNILTCLPRGIRRLQRLHILNLSKNKLNMAAIEIVTQIKNLTELKLADNDLLGPLLPDICSLQKLEVLDLHGNGLTDLPDNLGDLVALRVLNVADNQLASLPLTTMQNVPLVEINARNNKLQGHLIPASRYQHNTLQILNVTSNSLEALSEGEILELPNLQQLFVEENRIQRIPNISSWKSLLTLAAEGNNLSELPEGLTELKSLKHADFTGNDIKHLDYKIGLMENLISLRVANNPLRERKLLAMDIEEIKRELRSRLEPEERMPEEEEGSVQTEFTLAPESPTPSDSWRLKHPGVLDRSATKLSDLDPTDIEKVTLASDIRCLKLSFNSLEMFPVDALSVVAHTLLDLDLSNNPLKSTELFKTALSLPSLQSLTLNSASLTTLESLTSSLSAPSLSMLDVSNNKLTGSLPPIRSTYPKLMTFLISDNQIESLEFDAVRGLQVLDVSNNNIDFLPPKLGILGVDEVSAGSTALRRFEVAGNSFRVPRWQIVSKGSEAVLDYLKNKITDEEYKRWAA